MNSDNSQKVRAMMILEVLGRPAEHIKKALEGLLEKMKSEKGVKVISGGVKDPLPLKENPEFFTTHSEVEVEVDNIMYLVMLMFKYMPAHIEVLSPEKIILQNNDWGEILSEITRKLHSYDEVARVLQNQSLVLQKKLKEEMEKDKEKKEEPKKKK